MHTGPWRREESLGDHGHRRGKCGRVAGNDGCAPEPRRQKRCHANVSQKEAAEGQGSEPRNYLVNRVTPKKLTTEPAYSQAGGWLAHEHPTGRLTTLAKILKNTSSLLEKQGPFPAPRTRRPGALRPLTWRGAPSPACGSCGPSSSPDGL